MEIFLVTTLTALYLCQTNIPTYDKTILFHYNIFETHQIDIAVAVLDNVMRAWGYFNYTAHIDTNKF